MSASDSLVARVRAAAQVEDETSRRILDAAVDRFAAVGIRRTTMEDVARAAGIGRATLYRRFDGRDDIVRAAVLRELARFITQVDDRIQAFDDPVDRFVEGFVAILRATRNHPLLSRMLEIEPELILPFLTVQAGPVLELSRDYLSRQLTASRQGGALLPHVDVDVAAELLVRLCQSLLLTPGLVNAGDDAGLERLARRYLAPMLFVAGDTST